jgi:hypothetical protein
MKSKKSKKHKRTKFNLFREICFKPKNIEIAAVVLICAGVVAISFFGSGKNLYDYNQKIERSVLNSQPEIRIVSSVIAAENQTVENTLGAKGNVLLEENKDPEAMFVEVNLTKDQLAKDQVDREVRARARTIARQHASQIALINNAPVLAGETDKLPNGLRICPVKSDHPQRRQNSYR